jgi:hypothetical protein
MRPTRLTCSLLPVVKVSLLVLPLLLATPSKAFGYTDPGTGAFVYQAVYAAFLGGTFYLRKFLNRFRRRRK